MKIEFDNVNKFNKNYDKMKKRIKEFDTSLRRYKRVGDINWSLDNRNSYIILFTNIPDDYYNLRRSQKGLYTPILYNINSRQIVKDVNSVYDITRVRIRLMRNDGQILLHPELELVQEPEIGLNAISFESGRINDGVVYPQVVKNVIEYNTKK